PYQYISKKVLACGSLVPPVLRMISLPQALAEGSNGIPIANGRGAGEASQHRHRWLLPASPAAARPPRAATSLRRREARLRIFVVRCSLPSDPPAGGHSCNGGRIPRFHRPVCD